jgi:hypothetical protein
MSGVAILRGMADLVTGLGAGRWGLLRARAVARAIEGHPREVRCLVALAFSEDVELRKRAADVMRRMTEKDAAPLRRYADELGGLLVELPVEESRTRWHMGLVVARVAHTREQRLRAARLMSLLVEDESNVVRCSGVEGMGELAVGEASLRGEAEELIARALLEGTKAMKCRARDVQRRLAKAV